MCICILLGLQFGQNRKDDSDFRSKLCLVYMIRFPTRCSLGEDCARTLEEKNWRKLLRNGVRLVCLLEDELVGTLEKTNLALMGRSLFQLLR